MLLTLYGCAGELDESFQPANSVDTSDGGSAKIVYRPTIQTDLEANTCVDDDCHGATGIPMVVHASPSIDATWLANYAQVKARAPSSLLVEKPLGSGGHDVVLQSESTVLARWRSWIKAGTPYQ